MKPKEPTPRGFQICSWYELVNHIRLTNPRRYLSFSMKTVRALEVYLEMKERHEKARAA